jgi:hypothetical protein
MSGLAERISLDVAPDPGVNAVGPGPRLHGRFVTGSRRKSVAPAGAPWRCSVRAELEGLKQMPPRTRHVTLYILESGSG